MKEEIRVLKEILDNADLDNYSIDDDECYLNGYARKCLKKVLEELEKLNQCIKDDKENADEIIVEQAKEIEKLKNNINETLEYLDKSNMSFIDKDEIAIRLRGDKSE